jgi:hypothetical protein
MMNEAIDFEHLKGSKGAIYIERQQEERAIEATDGEHLGNALSATHTRKKCANV